jgi:hypothetical protein
MNDLSSINSFIGGFSFFEFSFYEFSNNNLTIVGSEDIGYYHLIEIKFENVFSVISNTYFRVNPEVKSFSILEGEKAHMLNIKYHVERGNTAYKILTEDGEDFYIIAESCTFRKNTVKYNV